jgi:ABC-type sulfate/molybdate transport systems ATPase subunit
MLGLHGVERARPWELSGGEQQRVALARALVTEPDALLLDEPLAALDVESRSRIRLELRDVLRRLAIPTVVVSHDFDDARVLGDRIAAMDRGRVVQIGTADELAAYPEDDFVATLTGTNLADVSRNGSGASWVAFDPWSVRLSAVPTGSPLEWRGEIIDMRPLGAHVRIALRGPQDLRADVEAADAVRAGYRVGSVVFASVVADDVRNAPAGRRSQP